MERIETEATIGSADSRSRSDGGLPTAIDSLTHLESYYQSRYEYYLAMATEAKENRERVGLLLLDLGRDVFTSFDSEASHSSKDIKRMGGEQNREKPLAPDKRVSLELPQTDFSSSIEESTTTVVNEESQAPSVSQMKQWTLDLAKAMSIIESVSNSDSGKALHQNYLHHLINREFERELSPELVGLYLEEAIRRGYLELDEFNNNCYIAKPKSDLNSEVLFDRSNMSQSDGEALSHSTKLSVETLDSNVASTSKATNRENKEQSQIKSGKLYDLPPSDKLKPTLCETIEEYIALNHPKRFSIDDVVDYLYPQDTQLDWDKTLKNKVRASISNVLSRKTYLNERWTRIKVGVYRPLTKKK